MIMTQKIGLACKERTNEAIPLSSPLSEKHKGWGCCETWREKEVYFGIFLI